MELQVENRDTGDLSGTGGDGVGTLATGSGATLGGSSLVHLVIPSWSWWSSLPRAFCPLWWFSRPPRLSLLFHLGAMLDYFGVMLGLPESLYWVCVEISYWSYVVAMLAHLGCMLGLCWPPSAYVGPSWAPCWGYVPPLGYPQKISVIEGHICLVHPLPSGLQAPLLQRGDLVAWAEGP